MTGLSKLKVNQREKDYQQRVQEKVYIVVNELNNSLPTLEEPRNFTEVNISPEDFKKVWLKANFKEIKNIINNQTFLMDEPEKGEPAT